MFDGLLLSGFVVDSAGLVIYDSAHQITNELYLNRT
jgi:hypothetical protein